MFDGTAQGCKIDGLFKAATFSLLTKSTIYNVKRMSESRKSHGSTAVSRRKAS